LYAVHCNIRQIRPILAAAHAGFYKNATLRRSHGSAEFVKIC